MDHMNVTKSNLSDDKGINGVILSAIISMVFSMLLIGALIYNVTENAVVDKLKNRDLSTIADLVATKVDGKIQQAIDVSRTLSNDPAVIRWLKSGETDLQAQIESLMSLQMLVNDFKYHNAFIVSTLTRHYWTEQGEIADTISEEDPFDKWYFQALAEKKRVAVNFDYNKERGDTFAFVNALSGPANAPYGIVGVGMSLRDLSNAFAEFTRDQGIKLWLVDNNGEVLLSDRFEDNGKLMEEILPVDKSEELLAANDMHILEYDADNELYDVISFPLQSTQARMIVEVERTATVGFLNTVQLNSILVTIISLITTVLLFFYISRKIANPYKRAVELNRQLEDIVEQRTKELQERNQSILDSIDYAKRLQESVLPTENEMERLLSEHFVLWRPRDLVGGDFYWLKQVENRTLIAVGDCTGHGVPGAFMTLLAVSALDRIVEQHDCNTPAEMLTKLNQLIKQMLNQEAPNGLTNDGLDIGLVVIENDRMVYSGAKCILYGVNHTGVQLWKGDRKSVGYRKTPLHYTFTNYEVPVDLEGYYLTTDGFYDQNGGLNGYTFGKTQFANLIQKYSSLPMTQQKDAFADELDRYMGEEEQRDDITVLAFRLKARNVSI